MCWRSFHDTWSPASLDLPRIHNNPLEPSYYRYFPRRRPRSTLAAKGLLGSIPFQFAKLGIRHEAVYFFLPTSSHRYYLVALLSSPSGL